MLFLQILGAVAALALGIWLGLPGRYEGRREDIERAMDTPGGSSRKVRRVFTPLAWIQRKIDVSSGGGRAQGRRGFRLERPGEERAETGGAFKLRRPGVEEPPPAEEPESDRPFRLRHPRDA
jgi:hypothetical protein